MSSTALQNNECEPLIRLEHIGMRREYREVLSDVNLSVYPHDFVAITGPNGGGKTTLLRIILGLLKPTTGTVTYRIGDKVVNRLPFGYLPQKNQIDSHFPVTVEEVIASGLLNKPEIRGEELESLVNHTLEIIELQDLRHRPIGRLSGGQLQRTLLGRALISRPKVLVLDEPLSYIDKHFEAHLYGIVERVAKESTILLVSHEMSRIASMANRHLIVDRTLTECAAHHHYVHTECDD